MKSRYITNVLQEKSKGKFGRIIILSGARQTGKTTLAKNCFPEYTYLSIEDPVTRIGYSKLTADQWQLLYPQAVLDEVQKEPGLIESIKSVYDRYELPRYILLGSSQFLLLQRVKESLAGRCFIQELFPLTLPELLTNGWDEPVRNSCFQQFMKGKLSIKEMPPSLFFHPFHAGILESFTHYLTYGGYPALTEVSLSDQDKRDWLRDFVRTYLERDIRDLADFRNLEPFVRLKQTASLLTGQMVNYSQLAKEAGVSANTAKKFLTYLEISYQVLLLQPWQRNPLKRLSKNPKLHFLDPGIQQAVLRKQGELSGHEYESAIVAEIYKQFMQSAIPGELYHLRTSDGREIDLLIELEEGYIAIEIKYTRNAGSIDARHLSGLDQILDKPVIHSFILSNDMNVKQLTSGITAIPAAMFLT